MVARIHPFKREKGSADMSTLGPGVCAADDERRQFGRCRTHLTNREFGILSFCGPHIEILHFMSAPQGPSLSSHALARPSLFWHKTKLAETEVRSEGLALQKIVAERPEAFLKGRLLEPF